MPRTKKVTKTEEETIPVDEPETQPEADADEPQDLELKAFIESFADAAKVKIYRYDRNGTLVYAGSTDPRNCSEEFLQEVYGEGKYYLKLFDGQGKNIKARTVYIGPDETGLNMPVTPGVPASAGVGNPMMQFQIEQLRSELTSQRDQTNRLLEILVESRSAPAAPVEKTSMKELVEALASVQQMIAPKEPTSLLSEMVGFFKQGIEIGSAGNVDGGWKGIIGDAIKTIPQVAKEFKAEQPSDNGEQQTMSETDLLKHGLAYLKTRANINADPMLWVDFIGANMDEAQWQPLLKLLHQPFERIGEIDPEIMQPEYRPFFEQLYNGLKDAISSKGTSDGEPGNDGDARVDEAAGKGIVILPDASPPSSPDNSDEPSAEPDRASPGD
ncbi:MAG: hypothetical protein GY950_00825 [bacterium]|nr:hypothetical protein [bacterium]